ncbi:MAG: TonB-dependent receptor [Flavobacteriaceae bacterium]
MRFLLGFLLIATSPLYGQLDGFVYSSEGSVIFGATVYNKTQKKATLTRNDGAFRLERLTVGDQLIVSYVGFKPTSLKITNELLQKRTKTIILFPDQELQEVVITGTLKQVSKRDSPVPVELYRSSFFLANPTPSVFEAVQLINGVRPQLNCNVCNTGDIHINGQEGANTMVLIDGLPIVSGLASVYGLTGIPRSLIEQIEVIKGPASSLYGSEAIGGIINLITKIPEKAPKWSFETFGSSWGEVNSDLGVQYRIGKNRGLLGLNYFNYTNPLDKNKDNFTDLTLQHRISLFNKITSSKNSLGLRLFYEDRWGGEIDWTPANRGGNERYGESIYTKRMELFGKYDFHSDWFLQYSFNTHHQNSFYGQTGFIAEQSIVFLQSVWNKKWKNHDLLYGISYRFTGYDDNTFATPTQSDTHLSGLFFQEEWTLAERKKLLLGFRYDYNSIYGNILTPRINYKWNTPDQTSTLRFSWGTGYRIVNVFTEDHAALTGAREVVFEETLLPETSWNSNINWVQKVYAKQGYLLELDGSLFYTQFSNRILPNYETNPNQIRYGNLDQKATTIGATLNINGTFNSGLSGQIGATWIDTRLVQNGINQQPFLTERFTGNYKLSYRFINSPLKIDWTGLVVGPMRLPRLGPLDTRPAISPWIHDSSLQLNWNLVSFEIFGGIKNLLNFKPDRNSIARAFDPFDRDVVFDTNDMVVPSPGNPNALSFDPSYVYYSNQGRHFYVGIRLNTF